MYNDSTPCLQEQSDRVQTQLDEEEMKSSKLLQQVAKLEEQVAMMSQESSRKDKVGLSPMFRTKKKKSKVH